MVAIDSVVFINVKDTSFQSRVLRSEDHGSTFEYLPARPPLLAGYQFEGFAASESGLHGLLGLFRQTTGTFETYYWRSADWGSTWEAPQPLSTEDNYNSNIWGIAVWGSQDVYAGWVDGKYGGVFSGTILLRRSTDGGETFGPEQLLSSNIAVTYSLAAKENLVSVAWDTDESEGRSHVYVSVSRNKGVTFCQPVRIENSLYNTVAPHIGIANGIHFSASWRDSGSYIHQIFFARNNTMTDVTVDQVVSVGEFSLDPPYPNPFNNTTNVRLSISKQSHVKADVVNLLGQHVRVLLNSSQPPGETLVQWDGDDDNGRAAASGIYFLRISFGRNLAVKKVMLLK